MSTNFHSSTYLSGYNASFIEKLYLRYLNSSDSVDKSWRIYFDSLNADNGFGAEEAAFVKKGDKGIAANNQQGYIESHSLSVIDDTETLIKLHELTSAYQIYGHTAVNLDPLGLSPAKPHPKLNPLFFNLSNNNIAVKKMVEVLQAVYTARIGYEFMHIDNVEEQQWWSNKIEQSISSMALTRDEQLKVLDYLIKITHFEEFLHRKFPGIKRFSIEGGESTVVATEEVIASSAQLGIKEVVIGMAHRGRLNTLVTVLGKPYHAMFAEFLGTPAFPGDLNLGGDVKYHLGSSSDRQFYGHDVHITLTPNPSHLEAVNSVVLGRVRAKQDHLADDKRNMVLGVLLHGDASFAGQGSVSETLALSQLKAYHTGGTIHIIVNNQIGFTTNPENARSTRYCTDIAKSINIPILHVNGDDVEAVIFASRLLAEYRASFKKDAVLDIVCYRKYGHNEGDEPAFTQPIMYDVITKHRSPAAIYAHNLISKNVIQNVEYETMKARFYAFLESELILAKSYKPQNVDWYNGIWKVCEPYSDAQKGELETGVSAQKLHELGGRLYNIPATFDLNPKIAKQLKAKKLLLESRQSIDWATGEALAFATLLDEGFPIRMSGQDVERGTFSHRHAVLYDQTTERRYIPLNSLYDNQSTLLEIYNSNLSELGVLAFEYGYSFSSPSTLVLWEAQYGDFANGAQVIIDQFIASGETKWLRATGLVLLLPHGYEGQGPEHSSARLERFLQLCAADNMQVVNCSTPASYFHALRRQLHRHYRKPLVIMAPKSLLRHQLAVSTLADIASGTRFALVLPDLEAEVSNIKKVVLCSGKVYYNLYEKRQQLSRMDIAIIRLEQLYPFPTENLTMELAKYPDSSQVVWCQEEHKNMGAYSFVRPIIESLLLRRKNRVLLYAGRDASASTAAGYDKLHALEYDALLRQIFD